VEGAGRIVAGRDGLLGGFRAQEGTSAVQGRGR
jgi:hypothetical protein